MKCILNVTDHEYDKILQLTHDAIEWANSDEHVLRGIETLLGADVAEEMRTYDECRIEKHDDVSNIPRVELMELDSTASTRIE